MSLPLNPLGIVDPTGPGNYIQPNTGNPAANANVASYVVGSNVLNLTWPLGTYTQPDYEPEPNHAPFPLGGNE